MLIRSAYRFAAQPKPHQEAKLREWAPALRFVWNWALKQRRDIYSASEGRVTMNYFGQCAQLPALKAQFKFLKSAPNHCLQQVLKDLERAYANFFEGRADYPRKKKARQGDSCGMRFPDPLQFRVERAAIFLPKLGRLKIRQSKEVFGKPKNATLSYDGLRWQVSIQVEREVADPEKRSDSPIGLDSGVANSYADSLGNFHKLPVASEKEAKWIKKLQREVSRKKAGSKRHAKAKKRALKARRRILNRVNDARHKFTTKLVKSHGFVAVEDLSLQKMTKSAAGTIESPGKNVAAKADLNRRMLEQGHAETFRQLEYKMAWSGGSFVKVNPANTSRECPKCGHIHAENRLNQAEFKCRSCGHEANADTNAAGNILRRGQNFSAGGQPVKVARPKARGVRQRTVKREPAGGAA